MSIRPSYGRRSVLQVLSDGMSQRPPTGKSCCEDAALNAAEVDRLTRERDELHGHIAYYREMWDKQLRRADCAETDLDRMREVLAASKAERDELQAKLDDPYSEVNQKAAAWDRVEAHPVIGPLSELPEGDSYAKRVCKRLDQLEELESAVTELQPAGDRPTLDREAVELAVARAFGSPIATKPLANATDAIMALVPAVPSWLGDVPDKPEAKRIVGDTWEVDGRRSKVTWSAEEFRRDGYRRIALADAIDAEEAQRNAEDEQRIEEQAKALFRTFHPLSNWEENVHTHGRFRAAVRDGWTKEDQ